MKRPLKPKNWMGSVILGVVGLVWLVICLGLIYLVWTRVDWSVAMLGVVLFTYNIINTKDIRTLYKRLNQVAMAQLSFTDLLRMRK